MPSGLIIQLFDVRYKTFFCDENITNKDAMSGLVGKAYPIHVMLNRKSSADNAEDFLLFCSIEAWQCVLENLDACLGISLRGGEVGRGVGS